MARYEVRDVAESKAVAVHDGENANGPAAFLNPCDREFANRVCACLNALSGIPDPAAFVEAAKAVNKAAFAMRDDWAEASPEKRGYLWRTLHAANMTLLCAINEPLSGKAVE